MKIGVLLAVLIGGLIYVKSVYDPATVLAEHKKSPENEQITGRLNMVGYYFSLRDKNEDAISAFRQIVMLSPTSKHTENALPRLCALYQAENKMPDAREACSAYLRFFPEGEKKELVSKRFEAIKFKGGEETSTEMMSRLEEVLESFNESI
jgi:hypothetical protein